MSFLLEYLCHGTRLPFISWSIAGVPSSQALPGYIITAPLSVCVPDVIGALTVWIQKKNAGTKDLKNNMLKSSACRLHAHTTIHTNM